MSGPIVFADESDLRSYVERLTGIAPIDFGTEESITVKEAASQFAAEGDEDDFERWAARINQAITRLQLPNRAPRRPPVGQQRNGRKGKQPRAVWRSDCDRLWPQERRRQ